jgi:hypothetical protein
MSGVFVLGAAEVERVTTFAELSVQWFLKEGRLLADACVVTPRVPFMFSSLCFCYKPIRSASFLQVTVDVWTDHILVDANYAFLSGETEGYCKLESLTAN